MSLRWPKLWMGCALAIAAVLLAVRWRGPTPVVDPASLHPVAPNRPAQPALRSGAATAGERPEAMSVQALRLAEAVHGAADSVAATSRLQDYLESLDTADLARLADVALAQRDRVTTEDFLRPLVRVWTRRTPRAVADWAVRVGDERLRAWCLQTVVAQWSTTDSAAAVQWASALAEPSRSLALTAGASTVAEKQPQQFLEWQNYIQPGALRERLMRTAARGWAEQNPDGLLRQLADNPTSSGDWRKVALQALTNTLSRSDPPIAIRLIEQVARPGAEQDALIGAAVSNWFAIDPEVATGGFRQLTDEAVRGRAAEILAGVWIDRDADAAIHWIERLPAGAARDRALVAASAKMGALDQGRALALIREIGNPALRSSVYAQFASEH